MRIFRTIVLAAALVSPAACTDFLFYGSSGTYELTSANGERVPATVYSQTGTDGYTVTLLGGELRLRGDDSFRLDIDYLESDGHTSTRYTQGITGDWEDDGDTIWLDYVDPDTGAWTSLAAFRHRDDLEMTINGAVSGTTIRTFFRR